MEREIKFRAWDKKNKIMSKPITINGLATWVDHHGLKYFDEFYSKWENLMWLQYTGLKDKEGKEIYEGDMLREPAKNNYEKINYSAFEVFFHDGDMADNHIGFQMTRMHNFGAIAGGFCGWKFLPRTTVTFKIIGNIYEDQN